MVISLTVSIKSCKDLGTKLFGEIIRYFHNTEVIMIIYNNGDTSPDHDDTNTDYWLLSEILLPLLIITKIVQ